MAARGAQDRRSGKAAIERAENGLQLLRPLDAVEAQVTARTAERDGEKQEKNEGDDEQKGAHRVRSLGVEDMGFARRGWTCARRTLRASWTEAPVHGRNW